MRVCNGKPVSVYAVTVPSKCNWISGLPSQYESGFE